MSRPRFLALLLAFITLAVFLPVGRFAFVNFDDNEYVTENPFVKNGLTATGLRWAFTTAHSSNWHPLTWISHMTDCELFALNPGAHHFVNVLFHAANVALLFLLIVRLTREILPAAAIALLFAWHPLHVESVAWISERKDVLSTCFALLALLSYAKYVQLKSRRSYWLALLFFALGLMSKPMLVTLPFVLLLLDWWPLNRFPCPPSGVSGSKISDRPGATLRHLLWEKVPFFTLTVASCVITFIAQKSGEAVISLARVPLSLRLENAPVAAAKYVLNIFWPAHLCVFYPMPVSLPAFSVILSVAFLLLLTVAAWRWRRSHPYCLMGWLWFLGTLVPVIGLLQVGGQAMADRYTYIPSIGFFLALVFLARDVAVRIQLPRIIAAGMLLLLGTACILATENQLQYWRDGETLFRRAIAMNPRNDIALIDLGVALDAQDRFAESLVVYQKAEQIDPSRFQLHNNLGNVLGHLGRHAESLAEYRQAIALRPGNPFLHNAAGIELATLGRFADALAEFAAAEQCNPRLASPHLETAKVLFKLGRDPEAIAEFQRALPLDPGNYTILATIAHYLAASDNPATRDPQNALRLALRADELSGHAQPLVLDILAMAQAANGDYTNAITTAQTALDLATSAQMSNLDPIRQRLDLYHKNLPWQESFRAPVVPTTKP